MTPQAMRSASGNGGTALMSENLPHLNGSDGERPFKIEVADRVNRLPPTVWPHQRAHVQKRRAGRRRDRSGDGQPLGTATGTGDRKTGRSGPRCRESWLHALDRHLEPAPRGGWQVLRKYGVRLDPERQVVVCMGSKEGFSHMCLALLGPGDTAIVPAPSYPGPRVCGGVAAGNVILSKSPIAKSFWRTLLTPASIFIRGPRWSCSTIRTTHRP